VVKDAIPNHVRDKLRFSHEDVSTFEGLKRAVMRIDNDFWKCQQEERHKFQAARAVQGYTPKAPRLTQGRPSPTLESPIVTLQVNFPWKITFDMLYTNEFVIRVRSRALSISSERNTI